MHNRWLANTVIDDYVAHARMIGKSDSTITSLYRAWRTIYGPLGIQYIDQCTQDVVEAWARRKLLAGITPQTVNQRVSALRALFGWAVKRDYISRSPLVAWESLRRTSPRFRRPLTNDEIRALFATESRPEWRLRWMVYLFTGLRSTAGASLIWEWIDLPGRIISLPAKHNKSRRDFRVPIHPRLQDALASWQAQTRRNSGPIYTVLHHSTILRHFKALCRRAGIDLCGLCVHSLRYTLAKQLYENCNHNIRLVQYVLDHAALSTTAGYLHILDSEKFDAIDTLDFPV